MAKRLSNAEIYEIARPEIEAEHAKTVEQIIEKARNGRRNSGRKPVAPEELRDKRAVARFNSGEWKTLVDAIGENVEFAAGLRELALEAARARLLEKEGTQNDGQ